MVLGGNSSKNPRGNSGLGKVIYPYVKESLYLLGRSSMTVKGTFLCPALEFGILIDGHTSIARDREIPKKTRVSAVGSMPALNASARQYQAEAPEMVLEAASQETCAAVKHVGTCRGATQTWGLQPRPG